MGEMPTIELLHKDRSGALDELRLAKRVRHAREQGRQLGFRDVEHTLRGQPVALKAPDNLKWIMKTRIQICKLLFGIQKSGVKIKNGQNLPVQRSKGFGPQKCSGKLDTKRFGVLMLRLSSFAPGQWHTFRVIFQNHKNGV